MNDAVSCSYHCEIYWNNSTHHVGKEKVNGWILEIKRQVGSMRQRKMITNWDEKEKQNVSGREKLSQTIRKKTSRTIAKQKRSEQFMILFMSAFDPILSYGAAVVKSSVSTRDGCSAILGSRLANWKLESCSSSVMKKLIRMKHLTFLHFKKKMIGGYL